MPPMYCQNHPNRCESCGIQSELQSVSSRIHFIMIILIFTSIQGMMPLHHYFNKLG